MFLAGYKVLDKDICCIYEIRCLDKFYIGRSKNLRKRLARHLWELRSGIHPNSAMQRCYNKHGENQFVVRILQLASAENLIEIEKSFLDRLFRTKGNINLIPFAYGGHQSGKNHHNFGKKASVESRLKMSLAHKGKGVGSANGMFGKPSINKGKTWTQPKTQGSKNCHAKLKESDIYHIFRLKSLCFTEWQISLIFAVSRGTISDILRRITLKHVEI